MPRIIKKFADGSHLEYDQGEFDSWCVYMVTADGAKNPPLDTDYFNQLKVYAGVYGVDRVYGDFVAIYNVTTSVVNFDVVNGITGIASTYAPKDVLNVDKLYTTLYMAMVAEENYPNTRLGRRIKRLGVYEMLYGGRTTQDAANFMRGKVWTNIDALCRQRGF